MTTPDNSTAGTPSADAVAALVALIIPFVAFITDSEHTSEYNIGYENDTPDSGLKERSTKTRRAETRKALEQRTAKQGKQPTHDYGRA